MTTLVRQRPVEEIEAVLAPEQLVLIDVGWRPEHAALQRLLGLGFVGHLDIPLNLHPKFFPAPGDDAARVVIAAERAGGDPLALAHAILTAIWTQEKDITDHPTLIEIANASGHDGAALVAASQEPEAQAAYEAQTQEALDRGVFGAPTYIYKDELFWGQDRLDFLDRALAD